MKKIISLLLAVAMIASLSIVSFAADANAAGGMHTVITETDTDITVTVNVANTVNCSSITSYLISDKVAYVADSAVAGDLFTGAAYTAPTASNPTKFVLTWTDASKYITTDGSFVALTYKVTKNDPSYELSEADFAYGTGLKVSKVATPTGGTVAGIAAGNNFTNAKQAAYFTIDYVDARTPVVDEPAIEKGEATEELESATAATAAAAEKGTLTFVAKVSNEFKDAAYGVIVAGKKFFGAPASSIADPDFAWDGSFEIVLTNITEKGTAGEKAYQYFVGDAVTNSATVNVVAE